MTSNLTETFTTEDAAIATAKIKANGRPILAKKVGFDGHALEPRPITFVCKLAPQGWVKLNGVARERLSRGSHVMVDYSVAGQITVNEVL